MKFHLFPDTALSVGFRFHCRVKLIIEQDVLRKWMPIKYRMVNHIREIVEGYRQRGEKASSEYIRDARVPLSYGLLKDLLVTHFRPIQHQITMTTTLDYEDICHIIPDLSRRLEYNTLPFDVQGCIVTEVFAAFKAAQTNRERGNNNGYTLREVNYEEKRMHSLSFTSQCASVNEGGVVRLLPRSLEGAPLTEEDVCRIGAEVLDSFRSPFENPGNRVVGKGQPSIDSRLPVKDKLLHFLGTKPDGGRGWNPVSNWGTVIPFGKAAKGKGFKISYDTTRKSWWLSIAYDILEPLAPFCESFRIPVDLDSPRLLRDSGYKRAHQWLARHDRVYTKSGNACAIDPGIRVPLTVFDANKRNVVKLFPDLPVMLDAISLRISNQQSRSANRTPSDRLSRNFIFIDQLTPVAELHRLIDRFGGPIIDY